MTKEIISGADVAYLVDDEDYDFFNLWRWKTDRHGYASRITTGGKVLPLHIEIMKRSGMYKPGLLCDHKSRDKTDCRKQNLRMATRSQSSANRSYPIGPIGFRGVRLSRLGTRFRAYINHKKFRHELGTFPTALEAARAYDCAAKKLNGDFAVLNFPEDK